MPEPGYIFDAPGARRVVAATRRTERILGVGLVDGASDQAVAERLIWVKITGNATGGGKYTGKSRIAGPSSDVSASSSVAESDLGTFAPSNDCLVLNFAEEGESTHDLTAGTPKIDTFLCHWFRTNSDDKKVCAVVAYDRETCA